MKQVNPNINTKDYVNSVYGDPTWKHGYQDAYRRLDMIVDMISPVKTHLDIGCADGYFTSKLIQKYPTSNGHGIDLSDVVISQITGEGTFVSGSIYELPYEDNFFDLVHMGEILEHLQEPQRAIDEATRVLHKGGPLILTTPNDGGANDAEHLWHWTVDDILGLLKHYQINTINRDFFNGHILLIIATKQ